MVRRRWSRKGGKKTNIQLSIVSSVDSRPSRTVFWWLCNGCCVYCRVLRYLWWREWEPKHLSYHNYLNQKPTATKKALKRPKLPFNLPWPMARKTQIGPLGILDINDFGFKLFIPWPPAHPISLNQKHWVIHRISLAQH